MKQKSKIIMKCNNGIWTVETTYYNVPCFSMADNIRAALSGLKSDMHYIEYGLAMRLIVGVAS